MEIVLGGVLVELVNEVIGPLIKELGLHLEKALEGIPRQVATLLLLEKNPEKEDLVGLGFMTLCMVFIVWILRIYNRDKQ